MWHRLHIHAFYVSLNDYIYVIDVTNLSQYLEKKWLIHLPSKIYITFTIVMYYLFYLWILWLFCQKLKCQSVMSIKTKSDDDSHTSSIKTSFILHRNTEDYSWTPAGETGIAIKKFIFQFQNMILNSHVIQNYTIESNKKICHIIKWNQEETISMNFYFLLILIICSFTLPSHRM